MCSFNKRLLSACFVADILLGAGHSREVTGLLCSNGADVGGSRQQTLNNQMMLMVYMRAKQKERLEVWSSRRGVCRSWGREAAVGHGAAGPLWGSTASSSRESAMGLSSTSCVDLLLR